MNICIVSLDYPSATGGGGVGNQVQIMARGLVEAGNQVTVVDITGQSTQDTWWDAGVRVCAVHRGPLHWYASKLPGIGSTIAPAIREYEDSWAVRRLVLRLHAEHPFDVIESTETGSILLSLLPVAPIVTRLHGERFTFARHTPDLGVTSDVWLQRVVQRIAIRRSARLIAPSRHHASVVGHELRGKHAPIEVIPNVLDAEPAPSSTNIDSGETPHASPLVLFVGRIERVKGVPLLFRAARLVLDSRPDVRFVLAGAPHPTLPPETVDGLIRAYAIESQVDILGHVDPDRLATLYHRADVFVVPSHYESFGVAALEALREGVPVVATRAGALPELIEDNVNGLLVPPGDARAMAKAILRLLDDADLHSRLAVGGRERAADFENIGAAVAATLRIYNEVTQPIPQIAPA